MLPKITRSKPTAERAIYEGNSQRGGVIDEQWEQGLLEQATLHPSLGKTRIKTRRRDRLSSVAGFSCSQSFVQEEQQQQKSKVDHDAFQAMKFTRTQPAGLEGHLTQS